MEEKKSEGEKERKWIFIFLMVEFFDNVLYYIKKHLYIRVVFMVY